MRYSVNCKLKIKFDLILKNYLSSKTLFRTALSGWFRLIFWFNLGFPFSSDDLLMILEDFSILIFCSSADLLDFSFWIGRSRFGQIWSRHSPRPWRDPNSFLFFFIFGESTIHSKINDRQYTEWDKNSESNFCKNQELYSHKNRKWTK